MKSKKADVWVSAVLYFGLGIIVISLLLAAGLPAINKLRDKNVIIQTKEVFQVLDKNIRDVVRGGPGSQRVVSVDIKKGDFKIDGNDRKEIISWEYTSKIAISEPGNNEGLAVPVSEGNLKVKTWREGDGFKVRIWIQYYDENSAEKSVVDLDANVQTISGISDLSIRNDGQGTTVNINSQNVNRIKVTISEI
ncbi:MAG TPA: hypothetical protein VJG30_04490 [Candidatus Nanoarchaeia archaeon]|nr:hypothetical protein [Candidatus Nanoarchaeia archaeon]